MSPRHRWWLSLLLSAGALCGSPISAAPPFNADGDAVVAGWDAVIDREFENAKVSVKANASPVSVILADLPTSCHGDVELMLLGETWRRTADLVRESRYPGHPRLYNLRLGIVRAAGPNWRTAGFDVHIVRRPADANSPPNPLARDLAGTSREWPWDQTFPFSEASAFRPQVSNSPVPSGGRNGEAWVEIRHVSPVWEDASGRRSTFSYGAKRRELIAAARHHQDRHRWPFAVDAALCDSLPPTQPDRVAVPTWLGPVVVTQLTRSFAGHQLPISPAFGVPIPPKVPPLPPVPLKPFPTLPPFITRIR